MSDTNKLNNKDQDAASPPRLILVHGAWHDSSCWNDLLPLLHQAGIETLNPDLPGHGGKPLDLRRVTLKRYCDFLVELLEQQPEPVALLGHSMAGMVITQAACRIPEKISCLIYLAAYLPRPGESLFDLIAANRERLGSCAIEAAMQLSSDKRSSTINPDMGGPLFYSNLPAREQQKLGAGLAPQATLPLSAACNFDQQTFSSLPSVYICCSEDRVIPVTHQRHMLSRQPCSTLLQLQCDHSPFFSAPQQLSSLLVSCLQE